MLVPSSYVPSACRAVAPASASQPLPHDCALVSRLYCLAARCLLGCQHPPHFHASLQPHSAREGQQTAEACLAISRKLHMQRCRGCRGCRGYLAQKMSLGQVPAPSGIAARRFFLCLVWQPLLPICLFARSHISHVFQERSRKGCMQSAHSWLLIVAFPHGVSTASSPPAPILLNSVPVSRACGSLAHQKNFERCAAGPLTAKEILK